MASAAQFDLFSEVNADLRRHVASVMESGTLLPVERAVLTAIMHYPSFGRHTAISIASIQSHHGNYSDRAIKGAVKSLLEEHGIPIGSCRTPGQNGYYLIISDKDAEEASRPLQNEIMSMFRRLKVLSPKSAFVRQLNGQMDMLSKESHEAT